MLTDMRTTSNLMKYLGVTKMAEGISISLDGKCIFAEAQVKVLEEAESSKKGPGGREFPVKTPTKIELSLKNEGFKNGQGRKGDQRRIFIELHPELYALGEVIPFSRILEPTEESRVDVKLILDKIGKMPSEAILKKAFRLYVME